jgi:WD40 repeat protein
VPRSIEVYESYNAGAVQRVVMFDDDGREIELWKNPEVGPVVHAAPRVLAFEVSAEAPVSRIRLHLASTQVPGWNEIDAVALVDESGKRHWADRAAASSTYADRDAGRYTPRPVMLAVSPQGKQLVTSGQATQLWDLETGRLLHRLEPRASNDNYPFYPHRSAGYAIAFSPDGGSIAVGTPYNVVLFDAATGQEIRQLPATTAGAAFLRFASDGRTLTLINNTFLMRSHPNGPDAWVCPSVQVWDVAEPRLLQTVP